MPDQSSKNLDLQSCLEHIDMLDRCIHEEIKEIRSCFSQLLDNCQSDVTMGDPGICDSTVYSQALDDLDDIINDFIPSSFADLPAPHTPSFGVAGWFSEGINTPFGQSPRGKFALFSSFKHLIVYVQVQRLAVHPVPPTMGPLLSLYYSTARTLRPSR
ncbi:hypothetical protein BDR04DRAFT_600825 [Suillus decipiens]|nr:hypothetical protein BDR04DRAFT_600825 [Suillus decipiens]